MLKYEYENATVYITKPTEKHVKNIKKATEVFMKKVLKEDIQNGNRGHHSRVGRNNSNARKRTQRIKKENRTN